MLYRPVNVVTAPVYPQSVTAPGVNSTGEIAWPQSYVYLTARSAVSIVVNRFDS